MSVNRAFLLGNLGQDPELRYTQTGRPVCTFSIATSEVRNDRDGNRQELTEWHRIVVWGNQAQSCAKYLTKGRTVFIEGRIQTRSWEDKNAQKRYTTEIVAQSVQFIGRGQESQYSDQGYQQPHEQEPPSYGSAYGNAPSGSDSPQSYGEPSTPNLDQIPFMRLDECGM